MAAELTQCSYGTQPSRGEILTTLRFSRVKLHVVPRDLPLTEYVRYRLRPMAATDGVRLNALERTVGVTSGVFTRILSGQTGVGSTHGDGFARLFGLANYAELVAAAHEWWREQGQRIYESSRPESHDDPEVAAAITAALTLGTSRDAVAATVQRYAPEIGRQDRYWWVQRFGEEMQRVDAVIRRKQSDGRAEKSAQAAIRKMKRRRAERVSDTPIETTTRRKLTGT